MRATGDDPATVDLRRASAPKLRFSEVAADAARNDIAWTRVLRPTGGRRR